MSSINQNNIFSNVSENITKYILITLSKFKTILPSNLLRINQNYLFNIFDNHLIHYNSPISLTYAWSFGSLAGICLIIQMVSGIFLAMHYCPNIDLAFNSVEYIMRDVNNGWLVRYIHANGASMFFIIVYCHVVRGLYYGSYMIPRELLWCSGVIILLLMMATAFTGYVLPWGQMSFWGATVITNMVTAVPIAGKYIVQWLWGGYTVSNPTLNRFFSIHFVLPFIIAGLSLIHLALLHKEGSNNPIGSDVGIDDIAFYPYFVSKDIFALSTFLVFFSAFVFYFPNVLNHPDNYNLADPLETPAHVVPEWYFLPYYAILRSVPHKTGGIAAMGGAILVLLLIPFINTSEVRNTSFRPIFKFCFWVFIADFIILTWVGQKPVRNNFVILGQIATLYYFIFFLFLIPLVGIVESALIWFILGQTAGCKGVGAPLGSPGIAGKSDKTPKLINENHRAFIIDSLVNNKHRRWSVRRLRKELMDRHPSLKISQSQLRNDLLKMGFRYEWSTVRFRLPLPAYYENGRLIRREFNIADKFWVLTRDGEVSNVNNNNKK